MSKDFGWGMITGSLIATIMIFVYYVIIIG